MAVSFLSSCENNKSTKEELGNHPDQEVHEENKELTIKVMTYNIHHANPPSEEDKINIDAIVKVIEAEKPDLVALQEVDFDTERSGEENQAELIAEALDMQYYFAKAIDYDNGQYGNAILSKYPLNNPETHKLPNNPDENTEKRVLAIAEIEIEDVELIFGSTHLDYRKDSKSRILQVKELIEFSNGKELPLIIGGDFNDSPDSETIDLMDSEFERTCRTCPPTIPVNELNQTIDFVFYKHPENRFNVKFHKVIDEKYASDHLPVFAEIVVEK